MLLFELLLSPLGQCLEFGETHAEHANKIIVRQVNLLATTIHCVRQRARFSAQHIQWVLGIPIELCFFGCLIAVRT